MSCLEKCLSCRDANRLNEHEVKQESRNQVNLRGVRLTSSWPTSYLQHTLCRLTGLQSVTSLEEFRFEMGWRDLTQSF